MGARDWDDEGQRDKRKKTRSGVSKREAKGVCGTCCLLLFAFASLAGLSLSFSGRHFLLLSDVFVLSLSIGRFAKLDRSKLCHGVPCTHNTALLFLPSKQKWLVCCVPSKRLRVSSLSLVCRSSALAEAPCSLSLNYYNAHAARCCQFPKKNKKNKTKQKQNKNHQKGTFAHQIFPCHPTTTHPKKRSPSVQTTVTPPQPKPLCLRAFFSRPATPWHPPRRHSGPWGPCTRPGWRRAPPTAPRPAGPARGGRGRRGRG